jgi:hypothetical protein
VVRSVEGALKVGESPRELGAPRRLPEDRERDLLFVFGEREGPDSGGCGSVLDDDCGCDRRGLGDRGVLDLGTAEELDESHRLLDVEQAVLVADDYRDTLHLLRLLPGYPFCEPEDVVCATPATDQE